MHPTCDGPHLVGFAIEAADPLAAASFWATALEGEVVRSTAREVYVRGAFPEMAFRPEQSVKSVKNRVHVDVAVASVDPLLEIGARVLTAYPDDCRATLSDGRGNEFCAFIDPDLPAAPMARLFAVCTDSAEPETIAAWWAARTGARIGPGPDGTPRWLYDAAGWGTLVWKFVRVDDPRVVPNRWRWRMDDGAQLPCAGADFSNPAVVIDPDGNDFESVPCS